MKHLFIVVYFLFISLSASAQDSTRAKVEKLAGPRVGFTFLSKGSSSDFINDRDSDDEVQKNAFITQYGYQWETRFADTNEGVVGLIEWVFLVGGLEKGLFLPSATSMFGVRTSSGAEIAMGPNLSITGVSYVFAVGKNFQYGNLNVPINISYVPSKNSSWFNDESTGHRISLTLGFNVSL
jgi:hypothetical protein